MSQSTEVNEYLGSTPAQNVDRFLGSRTANFVIPRLNGNHVLELGVGHGAWTSNLLSRCSRVTTVERVPELLEALRDKTDVGRWTGVCCSFEDFVPSERYDLVVATYVLEHVQEPWTLLTRIAGWLTDEGRVAIAVPNAKSIHRRLAAKMGLVDDPAELGDADRRLGHYHCFTPERMEAIIVQAGFRIEEKAGLLAKALPNALLAHCSEQQLDGLFEVGKELPMEFAAILYYLVAPINRT
jgi:2-polyprenyl-3-methyl-5-hydroxy-6-metoxy-1,4-benzoquinol methylase